MDVARRAGIRWFVAYATTEAGVAANPIERPDRWRLDSPGLPLPDVTVRVVDSGTGVDVGPGETGEIVVRGPSMMLGYLPETDTADAFLPGGWLRTGDIGWIEPEGWVRLTDRSKEMIKVSGFQVAPAELERLLFTHPHIADCAVYGVPDPRTGEAPKAAVVRTAGSDLTTQGVINFVAQHLATYKHLRAVRFVDAIPRNPAGKVLRRALRDTDPDAA
jgi:acyl-CoA synthetase (AMP-forming)/AMP-acid ligase II